MLKEFLGKEVLKEGANKHAFEKLGQESSSARQLF